MKLAWETGTGLLSVLYAGGCSERRLSDGGREGSDLICWLYQATAGLIFKPPASQGIKGISSTRLSGAAQVAIDCLGDDAER